MKSLRSLDWSELLQQLQNYATSGAARMILGQIAPLSDAEAAKNSFDDIFDAAVMVRSGVRPHMESLDLFEPWHTRVKRNAVLKTLELKDLRHFCLEVIALRETAKTISNNWSKRAVQGLMEADEPLSAIDQILTPAGDIRMDASETLYRLSKEKENLARQVQSTLDKLVKAHDMETRLQDKYVTTRDGRWVLPIRSGMQHYVPGVIHGSSQTKQTVFMEPQDVIPLNNRLRQIEVEIEEEIERLLIELSNYMYSKAAEFLTSKHILEEADQILAKAQLSIKLESKPCQFSENEILLNEVKHPLMILAQKPIVANSVHLTTGKSILLLSGPNAGGKTVLLKSIGLAAQMARCGLPICASENSRIPFFKNVHVGIGDSQSVGEELSTFAAHLKVLEEATLLKGYNNLILFDEICSSTDPEEGSALARSFIESFAAQSCFAVITSHLGPLKTGWKPEDKVLNGSLEYDAKSGRPTYQFLQGIPGDSLAIQTAKRVGVQQKLIDRAMELLTPVTRTRLAGLEELDRMKSDIQALRDHLKKETARAKTEKEKYETMSAQFEKQKEDQLLKITREYSRKIDELISQAKAEETLKKHSSLQNIKATFPEIVKSKVGVTSQQSITTAEEFAKAYPPGSKMFVPSLNQDGLVQSEPNSKGEVQILSNSIRLTIDWKALRPPEAPQNPTADIIRRSSPKVTVALVDTDKTIDLRGMTTEEAISELEMQLDNSTHANEDRIKIIHGHGTEALKKAVRTYLSRSMYVKKWKAGAPEQGGDGITWAELTDG